MADAQSGGTYNAWKATLKEGWGFGSILPQAGSCAPFTATLVGVPVSLDLCPAVAMIRMLLGWLTYIATAWMVFRIFMSPFGGV